MKDEMNLKLLASTLDGITTEQGLKLTADIIPGEIDVLQVQAEDREEFPIYVTVDDSQILCVSYMWKEPEVKEGKREELLDALLTMNIPMPLSAFSKVGDQYIIFGALSKNSDVDDVAEDIEALSNNTMDALEILSEYLK